MNLNWIEDDEYMDSLSNREQAIQALEKIKAIQAKTEVDAKYIDTEISGFKVKRRILSTMKWNEIMIKLNQIQTITGLQWTLNNDYCVFLPKRKMYEFSGTRFSGESVRDHAIKAIEICFKVLNIE